MAKTDIRTKEDIQRLVETFYASVKPDPVIGHFFTGLDWDHHIPLITSFWAMVLLGERTYTGDPMTAHRRLHQRMPMQRSHFDHWLSIWEHTVDELFAGMVADEAKQRAHSIAAVMAHKVTGT
ncbi:MAG: group III truncated hemoglobin [Flavobacteriales bacterium]|nr:group III truncated hemoglobin [Flavobacteriales bacterium]